MLKFLIIFGILIAAVHSFNYVEFQKKYCYEDTQVRSTAFYFPYDLGIEKIYNYSYVCENFKLTKDDDLDYMARNIFSISSEANIVMKNCEIEYFNEYLVSKFLNINRLFFENCKLSFKNPNMIASTATSPLFYIGFHKCYISDNKHTLALQKFKNIRYIFIQNSTFEHPYIDESFLPQKNNLFKIAIDNTKVESFAKGFLSNVTSSMEILTCTSCQLNEVHDMLFEMETTVSFLFSFANNYIKRLPTSMDVFGNFNMLPEINLSGNKIKEKVLNRNHLKSLKSLKFLDLSRNSEINSIGYLAFKDTYLQKLNMSRVNLETMDKLGNANLTSIDLSHNLLSSFPVDSFEDLIYLSFLDLSHNKIEEFQGPVFGTLRNLEELRLNSNKIKEIPKNLFIGLKSLEILDLSCNALERIGGLEALTELQELRLNNNYLKIIPSSLSLPSSLRILDVSRNSLNFIGRNSFSNIYQLTSLDISYTNNTYLDFDRLSFQSLRSLKTLKMSGNGITSIEDIFLPVYLQELNLENNKILTVTNEGLKNMEYLEYLNLANNHIHDIEKDVIRKLSKIKEVDLSGNDL